MKAGIETLEVRTAHTIVQNMPDNMNNIIHELDYSKQSGGHLSALLSSIF